MLCFMPSAQNKGVATEAVPPGGRCSGDPFSPEVTQRRRKLIAAINASQAAGAEKAEAALTKYLDDIYPESRLVDQ